MAKHSWTKSTLGHGEQMCSKCGITNREASILGKLESCSVADPPAVYAAPSEEGYYWAKLVTPSEMPATEDWVSEQWEIVEVFDNNGEGDESLGVAVPGVPPTQWVKNFTWGPRIEKPDNLE